MKPRVASNATTRKVKVVSLQNSQVVSVGSVTGSKVRCSEKETRVVLVCLVPLVLKWEFSLLLSAIVT